MRPFRDLKKMEDEGWIGGVCAGIAYWLKIPTWIVRMLWFFLIAIYGVGVAVYYSALDLLA